MTVKDIAFTDDLEHTLRIMRSQGLLLTSADPDGRPNVMTIGWGNVGTIWGRPVFIVYVRPSRFTFGNIEATGEFTVNVPTEQMKDTCMVCGQVSGRDTDKFEAEDLTPETQLIGAPLIAECVRHYECRVIHCNDVSDAALDAEVRSQAYAGGDLHRVYYGEILRAAARR